MLLRSAIPNANDRQHDRTVWQLPMASHERHALLAMLLEPYRSAARRLMGSATTRSAPFLTRSRTWHMLENRILRRARARTEAAVEAPRGVVRLEGLLETTRLEIVPPIPSRRTQEKIFRTSSIVSTISLLVTTMTNRDFTPRLLRRGGPLTLN